MPHCRNNESFKFCDLLAETGASVHRETDENVDEANRPADVQLDSPSKVG